MPPLKAALAAALSLLAAGCGSSTPITRPSETPEPYFRWRGAPVTSEQMAYADMAWEKIAVCVGLDAKSMKNFPIDAIDAPRGLDTVPWPLHAYDVRKGEEVAACGSSTPMRISIVNIPECFEGGLPTEIMHVAMWRKNIPGNADYSSPIWVSCRWW